MNMTGESQPKRVRLLQEYLVPTKARHSPFGRSLTCFREIHEALRRSIPPETVCTSTRPEESPTWARNECLLCSSMITGISVRIPPEVDSADSRKLAFLGTLISTLPDTVFRSHNRLPVGLPETLMDPEMRCIFTSLLAPTTSTAPLADEASTRSPGFSIRIEPEAAVALISPFVSLIFTSPEALFTRTYPPIPEISMEPLAAETCTSRSTL